MWIRVRVCCNICYYILYNFLWQALSSKGWEQSKTVYTVKAWLTGWCFQRKNFTHNCLCSPCSPFPPLISGNVESSFSISLLQHHTLMWRPYFYWSILHIAHLDILERHFLTNASNSNLLCLKNMHIRTESPSSIKAGSVRIVGTPGKRSGTQKVWTESSSFLFILRWWERLKQSEVSACHSLNEMLVQLLICVISW